MLVLSGIHPSTPGCTDISCNPGIVIRSYRFSHIAIIKYKSLSYWSCLSCSVCPVDPVCTDGSRCKRGLQGSPNSTVAPHDCLWPSKWSQFIVNGPPHQVTHAHAHLFTKQTCHICMEEMEISWLCGIYCLKVTNVKNST